MQRSACALRPTWVHPARHIPISRQNESSAPSLDAARRFIAVTEAPHEF